MTNLNKYVDYHIGDIPIIISAPHGGKNRVEEIPTRIKGIVGIDKQTDILALDLVENIKRISERRSFKIKNPSYIISKVHRCKVDLNREETDAYNHKSKLAKEFYRFYHDNVKEIILHNLEKFGHSLLVDIHGFEKNKRPAGFRDVELILGTNNLSSMFPDSIPKKLWGKNLRGKIIKRFNELNIPIAPGHRIRREYALTGGYIIKNYGASKIKNSQAIQIEFSDRIRLYDQKLKEEVIITLSELLYQEFI